VRLATRHPPEHYDPTRPICGEPAPFEVQREDAPLVFCGHHLARYLRLNGPETVSASWPQYEEPHSLRHGAVPA
jgi:hypothetical protein